MDAKHAFGVDEVAAVAAWLPALALVWFAPPSAFAADDGASDGSSGGCERGLEVTLESCETHDFSCSFEEFERPVDLYGVADPEKSKCPDKSEGASARLAEMLREADRVCVDVRLDSTSDDLAGDFYADETDVGERLVEEGHAPEDMRSAGECFVFVKSQTTLTVVGSASDDGACTGDDQESAAAAFARAIREKQDTEDEDERPEDEDASPEGDEQSEAAAIERAMREKHDTKADDERPEDEDASPEGDEPATEEDNEADEDEGEEVDAPQCGDLDSCHAAYEEASRCDKYRESLDPDGDGVPCEESHCSGVSGADASDDSESTDDAE